MERLEVSIENVNKIVNWLKNRGGILVWKSINLSNPGKSWSTPALTETGNPYSKPSWESATNPERHITSFDEINLVTDKEVKRLKIAVRRSSNELSLKLTDASSERVRKACDKYPHSTYYFDYWEQKAVICIPDQIIPLEKFGDLSVIA